MGGSDGRWERRGAVWGWVVETGRAGRLALEAAKYVISVTLRLSAFPLAFLQTNDAWTPPPFPCTAAVAHRPDILLRDALVARALARAAAVAAAGVSPPPPPPPLGLTHMAHVRTG